MHWCGCQRKMRRQTTTNDVLAFYLNLRLFDSILMIMEECYAEVFYGMRRRNYWRDSGQGQYSASARAWPRLSFKRGILLSSRCLIAELKPILVVIIGAERCLRELFTAKVWSWCVSRGITPPSTKLNIVHFNSSVQLTKFNCIKKHPFQPSGRTSQASEMIKRNEKSMKSENIHKFIYVFVWKWLWT